MSATIDWSGTGGDVWARRWRETDRVLEPVGLALDRAIDRLLPDRPFRGLDVGCGPGTTSLALADRRPDASIVGCDLSQSLIAIARRRAQQFNDLQFVAEDAERAAAEHGPFELIFSRHGVMFFADPVRAFRAFRTAATAGAGLVFSCFQEWEANPWAAELASVAAGAPQSAPGREPSGFAFADVDYVREILWASGWADPQVSPLSFTYVAGEGEAPVDQALAFLADLGPAARILDSYPEADRTAGLERMRRAIESHERNGRVEFPAAVWIWSASAT